MDTSERGDKLEQTDEAATPPVEDLDQHATGRDCHKQVTGDDQRPRKAEGSAMDRKPNEFQIYLMEVQSVSFINTSRHYAAVPLLESLHELRPEHIGTMMNLGECYLVAELNEYCFEFAKKIRRIILKTPLPDVRDVMDQADKCRGDVREKFTAIVLLWSCCSIFREDPNACDALDGIKECIQDIDDIAQDVFDDACAGKNSLRPLVRLSSVLPDLMDDTKILIEGIDTCNMVDDTKILVEGIDTCYGDLRTRALLHCFRCKAYSLGDLQRPDEAVALLSHGVELMEERFGSNASKLFMYGEFLGAAGQLLYQHGKDNTALSMFQRARSALEECEPMNDREVSRKKYVSEWINDFFAEIAINDGEVEGTRRLLAKDEAEQRSSSSEEGKFSKMWRFFCKK